MTGRLGSSGAWGHEIGARIEGNNSPEKIRLFSSLDCLEDLESAGEDGISGELFPSIAWMRKSRATVCKEFQVHEEEIREEG